MLRRRPRAEVFTAVFSEAGRYLADWAECDAGILATRRCGYADAEQEAAGSAVSARRGGRAQHRSAVQRAQLLSTAADDCDQGAEARRFGYGDRPRRVLWVASEPCAAGATVPEESTSDRACRRLARSHTIALRCAGLYGVGHTGRKV